jgi:hypothetical protein
MTVQMIRRWLKASRVLLRPIFVPAAWLCLGALIVLWVIEFGYCVVNYRAGGWPAVWGYLQNITAQGMMDLFAPISWISVLLRHVCMAGLTVALWVLLRRSRSRTPADGAQPAAGMQAR